MRYIWWFMAYSLYKWEQNFTIFTTYFYISYGHILRSHSNRKTRVQPQQPNFFSGYSAATQYTNLHTFLRKHRYDPWPQMSRQMPRVDLKWVGRCCLSIVKLGHAHPLSRLSVHHMLRDSRWKLSIKRNSFLPNHWPLF